MQLRITLCTIIRSGKDSGRNVVSLKLILVCLHVSVDTVMKIIGECCRVEKGMPTECMPVHAILFKWQLNGSCM